VNEHSFILSELRHEIKRHLSHCGNVMSMPILHVIALKVKS